uniref:Uncharacterized protein n=1 Tax=Lactuca sativa TaxID=4236 RepID=A0A9R1WE89_LACSA|nr:hypothetical protein LSAT_V11C200100870 [Lactuca sativa]
MMLKTIINGHSQHCTHWNLHFLEERKNFSHLNKANHLGQNIACSSKKTMSVLHIRKSSLGLSPTTHSVRVSTLQTNRKPSNRSG